MRCYSLKTKEEKERWRVLFDTNKAKANLWLNFHLLGNSIARNEPISRLLEIKPSAFRQTNDVASR